MALDSLTKEELRELINHESNTCVSIFLPTHPVGPDMRQDPIRLKNLLKKSEEMLKQEGLQDSEINEMLSSIYELVDRVEFWEQRIANGLAIFVSTDFECIYRLPVEFSESVSVSDHFVLKQVLPYFSGNGKFFTLSLSQDKVKFLECTTYSCKEVKLEGAPENIDVIMQRYQPEPSLQFRGSGNRAGGDTGRSAYHGHSDDDDIMKQRIKEYFNEIARVVDDKLKEESAPLVIAGVDYYIPLYREVSDYKNLLDHGVNGNPDSLDNNSLHEKALEIVKPHINKKLNTATEKYKSIRNTATASHQLDDIVSASYQGKIECLFIDKSTEIKGNYIPEENKVTVNNESAMDLLDYAAAQTILNNGDVFVLDTDSMPDEYICAVYRF